MADHHPPSTPPTAHHVASDRLSQLYDLALERGVSLSASELPLPAARALDEDALAYLTDLLGWYIVCRHSARPVSAINLLMKAAERGAGAADTMLLSLVLYERILARGPVDLSRSGERPGRP